MIKSHVLYRLSYGLLQRPTRLASAQRARAPCVGGVRGRVKNRVGGLRLFKPPEPTYVQAAQASGSLHTLRPSRGARQ